jgi:hypothetical protein
VKQRDPTICQSEENMRETCRIIAGGQSHFNLQIRITFHYIFTKRMRERERISREPYTWRVAALSDILLGQKRGGIGVAGLSMKTAFLDLSYSAHYINHRFRY